MYFRGIRIGGVKNSVRQFHSWRLSEANPGQSLAALHGEQQRARGQRVDHVARPKRQISSYSTSTTTTNRGNFV